MRHRFSFRRSALPAMCLVAVAALIAASCSKAEQAAPPGGADKTTTSTLTRTTEKPAGKPKSGGRLAVGLAAETDSFNPYSGAWSASAYMVGNAVFDPLAAIDDQGVAHPYLAEDMVPNGDFTEWTIKLRPNIAFQNGQKLDAAAVKKNIDTAKAAPLTSQGLTSLQEVNAVNDATVQVKMNRPWSTFPAALAVQTGYMAAPAMLDDPAAAAAKPIGTGPFEFQDRQRDAFVNVKKNANYWRKSADGQALPYLDSIQFKVISDNSSRMSAMTAGDIDAAMAQTPDSLEAATKSASSGETQILTDAGIETDETVLGLNTTKPPFNDPIARQALQYGVDQQQLASTVYNGIFPGAWGLFEESSPYYISKEEAGYPNRDVEKAKQLVKDYEKAHGGPLEFSTLVPPDPQYLKIAQAFQAQVAEFGAKVNVESVEQTQLINRVIVAGNYQAAWFIVWSSPAPDRTYIWFGAPPNPNGLSLNFTRYDDKEINAALNEFRAASDPKVRIETIKRVQKSLAKNGQALFIVHNHSAFVYDNETHGLRSTSFPGTDRLAVAPYQTTPFLTSAWKDQA